MSPSVPAVDLDQPFAVADLGSNSFHMLVAEVIRGESGAHEVRIVDRLREMVRLAGGLDQENRLTPEARERALACLNRFGERIRSLPRGNVRIVGTNALRRARNAADFLRAGEQCLGHPIDIIAGHEEARLIYQGVAEGLDDGLTRRLVIDIGGGSTEFILGERFEPHLKESLHMGCVSMSERCFPGGRITANRFDEAELAARQELEAIEATFRAHGWESAIGASGTILTAREVVTRMGWCRDGITRASLGRLRDALIEAGDSERLRLDGLSDERRPVFVGGVAVLIAIFDALSIDHMRCSNRALREGLLTDLVGRIGHDDVREATVARTAERHRLDGEQAQRVGTVLDQLLDTSADAYGIDDELRQVLGWAARLHELGFAISHSQYHKHGAYLLRNMDLPGFGRRDQTRLAALVRYHRRKFPAAAFDEFPEHTQAMLRGACMLLRVAVVLCRRRSATELGPFVVKAEPKVLKLKFEAGFLDAHPLTRADLDEESAALKAAGLKLRFK